MTKRPLLSHALRTGAFALLTLTAPLALARASGPTTATGLRPPLTKVQSVRDTLHGVVIADPYRWLEDQNAPATREWLAEQDRYFHQVMDPVAGREALRARLTQLLRVDDISLPTVRGDRMFYFKRKAEQDQRSLYLRRDTAAPEELLLDANRMSPDHSISLRLLDVSLDGTLAAIGIQKGGEDEVTVQFLDVPTRKFRKETLPRARYFSMGFGPDGRTVYFSRYSESGPRLYRRTLGVEPARDSLLFGQGLGRDKILGVRVSDDGHWLLITVSHGSAGKKVEVYVKDLRTNGPIVTIVNDIDANFDAEIGGNAVYLKTNWDAPLGRIFAVELAHPERDRWHEVIPQVANPIGHWTLAGGRILVEYMVNVVSMLYAFKGDGGLLGPVPIGDAGAIRELRGTWSVIDAYLAFESYLQPARILAVRAAVASVTEWWSPKLAFPSDSFETRLFWYPSKDGTAIPLMLSMKKNLARDGSHPVYLTGYGGFDVSQTPRFRALTAVWMENGGIVAVPGLRGGGELGEDWHRAGMLEKKQNVFDDFIGAAEFLIDKKWTSPDRLAIAGGSNGGLLVGAAETQRPDLFRAVVCSFPLLDMIRYHRFLVASFWVPEYGSSDDAGQFDYLRAYSPYHHVSEGVKYPATLLVSGDSDTRVAPLHARKMTALLQASSAGPGPVLLRYDTKGGHSGGKPVTQQVDDDADVLRFLFWQCGMTPAPDSNGGATPSPKKGKR